MSDNIDDRYYRDRYWLLNKYRYGSTKKNINIYLDIFLNIQFLFFISYKLLMVKFKN